ncbi:MAG TPA: SRPBCC domain-containing protein [Gemmatimonadota bacterium]|nr:SRPBCC domain-containing protein [Gemmatimonadota bacterium]
MTTDTTLSLRLTRLIRADREAVFRAWTEPAAMREWFCPEGGTVEAAESDLRVGGRYRIAMRMPHGLSVATGVYREIDPPARLVFSWRWEEGEGPKEGETLVTVELAELEDATRIELIHEGFATADAREGHTQGWSSALDRLEGRFGY